MFHCGKCGMLILKSNDRFFTVIEGQMKCFQCKEMLTLPDDIVSSVKKKRVVRVGLSIRTIPS